MSTLGTLVEAAGPTQAVVAVATTTAAFLAVEVLLRGKTVDADVP